MGRGLGEKSINFINNLDLQFEYCVVRGGDVNELGLGNGWAGNRLGKGKEWFGNGAVVVEGCFTKLLCCTFPLASIHKVCTCLVQTL